MYDAVVTFVTTDPETGDVITKVYRVEFESEEDFERWLTTEYSLNVEKLTGQTVMESLVEKGLMG